MLDLFTLWKFFAENCNAQIQMNPFFYFYQRLSCALFLIMNS